MVVGMIDEEQQAFPDGLLNQEGMSLRDYMAAKAMQALISSPRMPAPAALGGSDVTDVMVADLSYKMADAMLKAREQ
jgi:hypothetical protein